MNAHNVDTSKLECSDDRRVVPKSLDLEPVAYSKFYFRSADFIFGVQNAQRLWTERSYRKIVLVFKPHYVFLGNLKHHHLNV